MPEPGILVRTPARGAPTRLPGKPLLDIGGVPMIVHVLRRAEAAQIGRVVVATDTPEIAAAVTAHGFEAVMTRSDHPSGSDRIYEALGKLDPRGEAEIVVNLQGDFPTILPDNIGSVLGPLADPGVDIATLAAEIHTEEEGTNPNVVKVVGSPVAARRLRAIYFTRAKAPSGEGPRYHHVGLYAYRRAARDPLGRGRSRHDPDREFGRGPGRRYPSSAAGLRPLHRRRMVFADPSSTDGAARRQARRHQDRGEPRPRAWAMPPHHPQARA